MLVHSLKYKIKISPVSVIQLAYINIISCSLTYHYGNNHFQRTNPLSYRDFLIFSCQYHINDIERMLQHLEEMMGKYLEKYIELSNCKTCNLLKNRYYKHHETYEKR